MSSNQSRAISLAHEIIHGRVRPHDLPDDDWNLLLLAAGTCCAASNPLIVSCKVLNNAQLRSGYFQNPQLDPTRN